MEPIVQLTFYCPYCEQEVTEVMTDDEFFSALVGRHCGECGSTHLHLVGFKTTNPTKPVNDNE
jgi:Zn finger protein HypA/HybF involved in hydrogenase expression